MTRMFPALALLALASTTPLRSQEPPMPSVAPGAPIAARVAAGEYQLDPEHTLIRYHLDHMGFTPYEGVFGGATGTMSLDPKRIEATKVAVTIPLARLVNANDALTKHLLSKDFFDAAQYPTASFVSTRVIRKSATEALLYGNLTVRTVTQPVVLAVKFYGAGQLKGFGSAKPTAGFTATTSVMRSRLGIGFGVPLVGDRVDLTIAAAFEKQ